MSSRTALAWCGLLILALCPATGLAAARILVAVGNNVGSPSDEPLRYAEQDAQRFHDLLVSLGRVEPQRAYLLLGEGRERVRSTLDEIRGRAEEIAGGGQEVTLLFYFSGHGDRRALHLGRHELERAELLRRLEELPVALRIVVLDTCSVVPSRTRGVRAGDAFDVYLDEEAATRGTALFVSTRAGEPAQESDRLQGAVFTHYLLAGLRGAADRDLDGRVTMSEAYGYAYHRTVLRSATGAPSLQHPSYDVRLSGVGDVVITEPERSRSALLLPPGTDARYLIYGLPSGTVLAEVGADRERPLRLALPPGRLLVQRRQGGTFGVTEILLGTSQTRSVASSEFKAVPYEEVALRGGSFDLHPTTLGAAGTVRVAALPGAPVLYYGPELMVSHRLGRGLLGARIGADFGWFDSSAYHVFETALRAELLGGFWSQAGPMTLSLQAGPRLVVANQSEKHREAARLERLGLSSEASRLATSGGLAALLGASAPITAGLSVIGGLRGSVSAANLAHGTEAHLAPILAGGAFVGLGWAP